MMFPRPAFMCACKHQRRAHVCTKRQPNGPCTLCACSMFTPEPMCRCKHGRKAHTKGPCKEAYKCGCKSFDPV